MKKGIAVILVTLVAGAHYSNKIQSIGHNIAETLGFVSDTVSCDSSYYPGPNPTDDPSEFIYGIDISHWQNSLIRTAGDVPDTISFVICKATEGNTYVDPEFKKNRNYLDSLKKFSGYYHFYRCNDSPRTQAQFYFKELGKLDSFNLPPIVDVETVPKGYQCNCDNDMDSLLIFLKEIENLTGQVPIVYTNSSFGNDHFPLYPAFAKYPLWVASWGVKQPTIVNPWKEWKFWQMTDHYAIGNDSIDLDVFHGTEKYLQTFIDSSYIN